MFRELQNDKNQAAYEKCKKEETKIISLLYCTTGMQSDNVYFGVFETCNRSLRLLYQICALTNYIILLYILDTQLGLP
jgi:hypothetical protein